MIPEPARRRERFDLERSEPVVMSDGQAWYLPRPVLTMTPVFKDGKPVNHWECCRYGAEIDSVVERIAAAEDIVAVAMLTVALAGKLLLHNYDLADEELSEVLLYRFHDPESTRLLHDVIDVATGGLFAHGGRGVLDDPKPPSAGSGPA